MAIQVTISEGSNYIKINLFYMEPEILLMIMKKFLVIMIEPEHCIS